jgi:hypothetical protein
MEVPMLRSLIAALALTFVTATVTPAQLAAPYFVTITNLDTGHQMTWKLRTYPDQNRCDAALGNWPAVLASVADPNPDVQVIEPAGADEDLTSSLENLIMQIITNTGRLPRFGISCEVQGDPA